MQTARLLLLIVTLLLLTCSSIFAQQQLDGQQQRAFDPSVNEWAEFIGPVQVKIYTETPSVKPEPTVIETRSLMDWQYFSPVDITETSGTTLTDYQVLITINTQTLIAAGKLKPDGSDLRFAEDQDGNSLLGYYIESGLNTASTRIWVKVNSLPANAVSTIYMFYGNPAASAMSSLSIFDGPHSATDSVTVGSTNSVVSNSQRGFRFSVNQSMLVGQFGKNTMNNTPRYITLFDAATQQILKQQVITGPTGVYSYQNLNEGLWLEPGNDYVLNMFQAQGDGYYFGASSQSGEHINYLTMQFCNNCTQNTFPTGVLSNYHYGLPDFHYYLRAMASSEPGIDVKPEEGTDPLAPWIGSDVGSSGPGNAYDLTNGVFTLTAGGNNAFPGTTTDAVGFINQELCGNGEIIVKIESVSSNGYAGLMARESYAANAKQASVFSNLSSIVRTEARSATGGNKTVQAQNRPYPYWLKLVRQGDWFFAYYSTNGSTFSYVHGMYLPMGECIQLGMAGFSFVNNQPATATFSNVSFTEAGNFGANSPLTGAQHAQEAHIRLFPNPATDQINLALNAETLETVTARLFNNLGVLLEQREIAPGTITIMWNINKLQPGMYYLELDEQRSPADVLRFIKQ